MLLTHNMREYWSVLSLWQFYSWTFCRENESISVKFTSLIVGVFEKILRNTHFLAFCLTIYCLKALFQVIGNDWQNLFCQCNFEVCTKFQTRKTFCRRWVVNCGRCVVSWLLCSSLDIKKSRFKPWLGTLLCSGTQHFTLTVPLSLPRCITRLT